MEWVFAALRLRATRELGSHRLAATYATSLQRALARPPTPSRINQFIMI